MLFRSLAELVGDKALVKREVEAPAENDAVKAKVAEMMKDKIYQVAKSALNKHERKKQFKALKTELQESLLEAHGEEEYEAEVAPFVGMYYEKLKKEVIREMVMGEEVRVDGRKLDGVRPIWTEVDYLPGANGASIFNRGETQALASLTLGTKLDQVMIDTALHKDYDDFILHYNFPALSVGDRKSVV